ncbi:HdeD family acid-resistance protein [Pleurocapsales cyanobacterium LEGE 06147]|nr:HdeD family acid-resistance protein [Pleurocapsales cyanobacterium LEGE 06147]
MRPNSNRTLRMGTLLARNWWTLLLRGLVAVLFGVAVLVWPGITLIVLLTLFGIFALLGGIFVVIAALSERRADEPWWLLLLEGLIGIAIGIIAFVWPEATGLFLLYLIAAWAIVSGIFELIAAIQLRRQIENEWLLAAAGIASLLFGLLLAIRPVAGALAIVWVIGVYAIIFGVLLIIFAFRLRNWNKQEPPTIV